MLLVAGVVWLRQLPSAIDPGNSGDVIEIHLLGPRTDDTQGQDVAEAAKAEPTQAADPLIDDDQNHAIPRDALAPMPPERLRPTPAHSSAIRDATHGVLNQKALMFRRALQSHIARYLQNPDGARLGRVSVQLVFSMLRDGTVTDVRITSSSGNAILDRAALQTIRLAQPMLKIPAELPQPYDIYLPITFAAN